VATSHNLNSEVKQKAQLSEFTELDEGRMAV